MTSPRLLPALLLAATLLLPPAWAAARAAEYPGAEWQDTDAAQVGTACQRELDATRDYLQTLDTTSLMAVRDGRVLFRYGDVSHTSVLASARKSILSMLYGQAVAEGRIDLDSTLEQLGIDDIGGLLPSEKQARVRDLISARSGVYHPAANDGDDSASAPPRGSQAPGSYYLYNNWDFNAAGTVYEQQTGQGIYQAFDRQIAQPLQLQDFDLSRHRRRGDLGKSEHLAYHFYLSARDMARIGYLMLQHGQWRDRQIVPADWVQKSTATVTPPADMHPERRARQGMGYGYLWWTLASESEDSPLHGAYLAWGLFGQFILVVPERQMVIVHKRQVPVGDNRHPGTVRPQAFLKAARLLASAPCG